jgi:hypothetical protein
LAVARIDFCLYWLPGVSGTLSVLSRRWNRDGRPGFVMVRPSRRSSRRPSRRFCEEIISTYSAGFQLAPAKPPHSYIHVNVNCCRIEGRLRSPKPQQATRAPFKSSTFQPTSSHSNAMAPPESQVVLLDQNNTSNQHLTHLANLRVPPKPQPALQPARGEFSSASV